MPPQHGFGQGQFAPYLPTEVKRLPIGLLRSHQYPGDPRGTAVAMEQYLEAQLPAAYYPQRMAFSRWKTPPVQVAYGQSAAGAYAAGWVPRAPWTPNAMIGGHTSAPPTHYPQRVPVRGPVRGPNEMGLRRMPMPTDNMDPNLRRGYDPLARGVPPANETVSAPVLNQYAVARTAHPAPPVPQNVTSQALVSVEAIRNHFSALLGEEASVPWFMRVG